MQNRRTFAFALTLALGLAGSIPMPRSAWADLCAQWSKPAPAGNFNTSLINESSGVVPSLRFSNRLYHNNDSGDDLAFYLTDLKGGGTTRVLVGGNHRANDVEDIGRGPCGNGNSCIFLADIGDNSERRAEIVISLIEEKDVYGKSVEPLVNLRLRYPDGPHNAEAFAVHPNGDLFIVTKVRGGPSGVYALPAKSFPKPGMVATLSKVGEVNLGALRGAALSSSSRVTGMDIAGHGRSFVLITYEAVIEFNFDLAAQTLPASSAMTNGKDFHVVVASSDLPQQEAVAYYPGDRSVIFESEQTGTIMKTDCLK